MRTKIFMKLSVWRAAKGWTQQQAADYLNIYLAEYEWAESRGCTLANTPLDTRPIFSV